LFYLLQINYVVTYLLYKQKSKRDRMEENMRVRHR